MTTRLRQAAARGTDVACALAGRRQVVRAARFVLRRACLDLPNDLHGNGEASLQRWVLRTVPADSRACVVDVGANVGRWSASMIAAARLAGRLDDLDLHAFEPTADTFALLSAALRDVPARLHNVALSDRNGWARLHVIAPGAGRNSLHEQDEPDPGVTSEVVATATLDSYAARAGLSEITLVKIDAEGHDLHILRGAAGLLAGRRIGAVQFEYNHRWISARAFLRDAFDLVQPHGYRIGKLTPGGVEFYPAWDPELETFVEGNYLACLPGLAGRLPAVTWWKQAKEQR
jgi:FkbM family methyltransferase